MLMVKCRDRENSTVFVAELPSGATTEELSGLFKDVSLPASNCLDYSP
jgi:hypothetical protein